MASLASAKPHSVPNALVFGPERDVPLSKSGLRLTHSKDIAFKCDPELSRWTSEPEGWMVRVAGYPQAEVIADGRISLPTFMIARDASGPLQSFYLRVCLIVTTATHNHFMPHPVMLSVPLVRHRGNEPLYGPAVEALSISDLRDGGREAPADEGGKAARKRGGLAEIISIWKASAPATFAIQVCAGEPDGSMDWAHPAVVTTMVFRHKRLANPTNERKKARKAKAMEGAAEVVAALLEDVSARKTPVGQ